MISVLHECIQTPFHHFYDTQLVCWDERHSYDHAVTVSHWFSCICVLDVSGLVRAVTQFAHLVGDVIVQGSATSHMVPVEQADGEHVMSVTQTPWKYIQMSFCNHISTTDAFLCKFFLKETFIVL